MPGFLIELTVLSTGATILVNPDHIVFLRESADGAGTQIVSAPINEGMVLPIVRETLGEIRRLCEIARQR